MNQFSKVLVLSTSIILGGTTISVPFNANPIEAASLQIHKGNYLTTTNLNMRTGAGTSHKVITTIPKGKQVVSSEKSGKWIKVSYTTTFKGKSSTKTGWVTTDYLKTISLGKIGGASQQKTPPSTAKTIKTSYHTTSNLNIRTGAGTNFKIVKTVPKGAIVSSSERKGTWSKIAYTYYVKGKSHTATGWVSVSFLKEFYQYSAINAYYSTNKSTGLYMTPDTKKKAVLTINAANAFRSTQKVVNSLGQIWYRVELNGKAYYVYSNDVNIISIQTIKKTDYQTNKDGYLYSSYGSMYTKLVKIPKNTKLQSVQKVGNWYKVSHGGKAGYIQESDVVKFIIPPSPVKPAPVPAPLPEVTKPPVSEEAKLTETALIGKTFVTVASLHVRESANSESKSLNLISNATLLYPTHKVSNGWYKVSSNGKTGYVSGEFIKDVITGDPLHRNGYQFVDLRKPSNASAAQIDQYINRFLKNEKESVLKGKGQAFINAGNKYGVNALYLAAHAILESGYGTSNISLGKYNLFGFGAYDATPFIGAVRFASIEQNIEYIAQEIKATYLNPLSWKYKGAILGFSTRTIKDNTRVDANSTGMNFYYASDIKWGQKIASHMQNILPYDKAYYDRALANTNLFPLPARPIGTDTFPAGIQAIAKKDLTLVNQKGSTVPATTVKKDSLMEISEKHNDYWVKVKLNNQEYWTSDIKFDRYNEFLTVKNLGRVTAPLLNIRPAASTTQTPIGSFKLNEYVHIFLGKDGNPVMDVSRTWYNVKLTDGQTGWVSAQYIVQELK